MFHCSNVYKRIEAIKIVEKDIHVYICNILYKENNASKIKKRFDVMENNKISYLEFVKLLS